jgi:hypothetical protein
MYLVSTWFSPFGNTVKSWASSESLVLRPRVESSRQPLNTHGEDQKSSMFLLGIQEPQHPGIRHLQRSVRGLLENCTTMTMATFHRSKNRSDRDVPERLQFILPRFRGCLIHFYRHKMHFYVNMLRRDTDYSLSSCDMNHRPQIALAPCAISLRGYIDAKTVSGHTFYVPGVAFQLT